ncbi:MAG: hypothetical protein AAGA06_00215 [Pseudomonadota bacterium]
MTKRIGAPPLRFKGRKLSQVIDGPEPARVSITLWARKSKGFTAAVSMGEVGASASADTVDDAMRWLESFCNSFAEQSANTSTSHPMSIIKLFNDLAVERALRVTVGVALDRWDQLANDDTADGIEKDTA